MKKPFLARARAAVPYVLLSAIVAVGVGSILATSSPTSTSSSSSYFYSNWSCGNQSQCIAVMGHNVGSAGPFCSEANCLAWNKTYIPGTSSCNASAAYPIYNAPSSGCE
ncbi:MAG TPA: hypothetical protein VMH39_02625 [Gemmatimonadaceae bacterium]|nr:hypothetical protein [Gemmatimonadaceae bacterium]